MYATKRRGAARVSRSERGSCGRGFSFGKMIYIVCVASGQRGEGGLLKQLQSTADMGEYYYWSGRRSAVGISYRSYSAGGADRDADIFIGAREGHTRRRKLAL